MKKRDLFDFRNYEERKIMYSNRNVEYTIKEVLRDYLILYSDPFKNSSVQIIQPAIKGFLEEVKQDRIYFIPTKEQMEWIMKVYYNYEIDSGHTKMKVIMDVVGRTPYYYKYSEMGDLNWWRKRCDKLGELK